MQGWIDMQDFRARKSKVADYVIYQSGRGGKGATSQGEGKIR